MFSYKIDYNNLIMEEKPLNTIQLDRATSRRSRKDEEGRDFQCGCGKRYLSYPALYTHIKTKHDGRQPEGTQKTGISMMAKRIKGKNEQQTLKSICSFLQRSDLKLLGELDQNHYGSVPASGRVRKELVPKQLYDCYCQLMKQQDIHITKTTSLDTVLVAYLFGVGEYVNDKLYDHYLLFARLVRSCYVQHGQQVYRACFSKKEGVGFIQNFSLSEVQYFPIICDCLVRYYIPFSESIKQMKDINLSLMELMLADFCDWLFKKKLTSIKVALNKEYRLQVKPVPIQKQRPHQNKGQAGKQKDKKQEGSISSSIKKEDEDHFSEQEQEEQSPSQDNYDIAIIINEKGQKIISHDQNNCYRPEDPINEVIRNQSNKSGENVKNNIQDQQNQDKKIYLNRNIPELKQKIVSEEEAK